MKQLRYVQIEKENEEHYLLLESLMIPYFEELDVHQNRTTSKDFVLKFIKGIQSMQGPYDRHLELCYAGEKLIGFLYGKVDHEDHKGFIKPGFGYIMEFYVKPKHRHKGYGKIMFTRLQDWFFSHGIKRMYLTADPVTGKPFWEAMGFHITNEKSPENGLYIYEKEIYNPILYQDFDKCVLKPLTELTVSAICEWEYETPYEIYSFKGHPNKYLLNKEKWGEEQFCLLYAGKVIGQVACQFAGEDLWVGWALAPECCGKGNGYLFVQKCVEEIRKVKGYQSEIYLRVAATNQRAIKAYQKAGFVYHSTIQDEVAYTNQVEDFLVMVSRYVV